MGMNRQSGVEGRKRDETDARACDRVPNSEKREVAE